MKNSELLTAPDSPSDSPHFNAEVGKRFVPELKQPKEDAAAKLSGSITTATSIED